MREGQIRRAEGQKPARLSLILAQLLSSRADRGPKWLVARDAWAHRSPLSRSGSSQEDGWKQAEFERRARDEPVDDLPGALIFLVRVGADKVEVQLVGVHFGEEVAAVGEVFEIEELIFLEAMHGFHVALVGVRGWWDAHMLAVAERFAEVALELAAIVGLPDQIAERNSVAVEMLLNT